MSAAGSGALAPGDDAVLVGRARRGDGAAFRALYDRHAPAVLAHLRRVLGDTSRAEDALAETFVRAHAGLATFDLQRPFAGWLAGIARRAAIDSLRSFKRDQSSGDVAEAPSRQPAPVDSLAANEETLLALELIAALPERARQVVQLRYREGLTQSETAAALGCSRRLVAMIQKEALETLARLARVRREEAP